MSKLIYYINWTALLLLAISVLQIYSNGSSILENLTRYQNPAAIRPMQWVNFGAGAVSLLLFILLPLIFDWSQGQLKNIHLGLIIANIVLMLIHIFGFWDTTIF